MAKVSKPRKHGNRWQINYTDATGKRQYRTYDTYTEALHELRRLESESQQARASGAKAVERHRTFDELTTLWSDVRHGKSTIKDDESRLKLYLTPAFGGKRLDEITGQHVARFERDLAKRVSRGTVRLALALLKAMFNVAEEHNWAVKMPAVKLPPPEEKEYGWLKTPEEIQRLLEGAAATEYPGLQAFYATAAYTGMRVGELAALRWDDISFERRLITVSKSYKSKTKSGKIRHVPLLDVLLPILTAWRNEAVDDVLVFPNEDGKMQLKRARVSSQTFHRILVERKLPKIRFHDLRHTFASHWVMNGGDLFRLQKILGHQGTTMTQRYAHLSPDAFAGDLGRFGAGPAPTTTPS